MEKTLSIIKPDAMERNLEDKIKNVFIRNNFKIVKERKVKLESIGKLVKSQNKDVSTKAKILKPILEKLVVGLEEGKPARMVELDSDDLESCKDLNLITLKKVLYVCNIDEDSLASNSNPYVEKVQQYASHDGAEVLLS